MIGRKLGGVRAAGWGYDPGQRLDDLIAISTRGIPIVRIASSGNYLRTSHIAQPATRMPPRNMAKQYRP
jgi:hypothetical protein